MMNSNAISQVSGEGSDVPHLRLAPQPETLTYPSRESHYAAGRAREPYDLDLRVSICSDRLPSSPADGVPEWTRPSRGSHAGIIVASPVPTRS